MGADPKPLSSSLNDIDGSILSYINDPVSIVDKDYIYRAVSRGYELMFQQPASEILGTHVSDLHGPEVFNGFLKPALDRTLAGESFEFQFSRPGPDGNLIHIHSKHSVYSGPLTEGLGVAVVARDITELINATQKLEEERVLLKKERTLLKNIINTLPDFIFAKDDKGVYQVVNRSFEEFINKPSNEILGKTDADLMSKESAGYVRGIDAQVLDTGEAHRDDEWVTYEDGRRRLLDMHKLPLVNECGEVNGVLGIGTNVTFESQAEQNRQIASVFFEVTNNPCFILNAQSEVLAANSAAQRAFDLDERPEGSVFDYFFDAAGGKCSLEECLGTNHYWSGELCDNKNSTYFASLHKVAAQSKLADRFVLVFQNPEDHTQVAQELLTKAYEDPLTKLPNRRLFFSKLESALIRAERQLKKIAVLYIDLNSFKPINDNFGHEVGDKVLIELARILISCLRKTDIVARIGGDEFAALVDTNSLEEAKLIVSKIHQTIEKSFSVEQLPNHKISVSIGISCFPDDAGAAEELLRIADQNMYKAKQKYKSQSV
ncbi:sensor domain-containing diguanylate cyclase [Neptuniibacter sp. QD48_55]|uniref:sensor domain-containing diguanylate cyclase n=1 Tax=Neptuniibacter sp. QD48_55 TaxID=3398212 RepID=UPI0039F47373